jgi:hypothetical protein
MDNWYVARLDSAARDRMRRVMFWQSREHHREVVEDHGDETMADIENYTNEKPDTLISEGVASSG